MRSVWTLGFRCAATLLLAGLSMAAQEPKPANGDSPNAYSLQKEAALGRQIASEVRKHTTPIGSPSVAEYLSRIGRRISAQMPDAFAFTFSVITDDPCSATHEPVSLPGGYVFLPAALFVEARDEAELAAMLAHSMEHIARRHATRKAFNGQLTDYGSIPLIFLGGWSGYCSGAPLVPMLFLATQRNNEMEADALAVQATARAGFDPHALGSYIGRVQPEPKTKVFSSLPDRAMRLAALLSIAEQQPRVDYELTSGEFVAIQREVVRLAASIPGISR
jgi:beta-barrel assembly-enhancing protease